MMDDCALEYLRHLEASGKATETVKTNKWLLRRFLHYAPADPRQANTEQLLSFIADPNCLPSTRYLRYAILKTFFNWLSDEGRLLLNPMDRIDRPKLDRALPSRVMTERETERVLAEVKENPERRRDFRDRTIVELMYSCSLRRSELVALNLEDYNAEAGALIIRKAKNRRGRIVPVGEVAARLLQSYIAEVRLKSNDKALFLSYKRKRLGANLITNLATRLRRKSGIRTRATSHSFRKSSATHMLRRGAPLPSVQALLGHVRMTSTQLYTKIYPRDLVQMHRAHHPREKQKNYELPELRIPEYLKKGSRPVKFRFEG